MDAWGDMDAWVENGQDGHVGAIRADGWMSER